MTNWDDPEEIKQKAAESKHEQDAEQAALLDAVAKGDDGIDVEEYEWVNVGEVDVKVKAWMPGESLDAIESANRLAKRDNMSDSMESIHTMIEGMTAVTETLKNDDLNIEHTKKETIRKFWRGMLDKWGIEGFQKSAEIILQPASEDLEEKSNAAEGFRGDAERSSPSDYK